MEEKTYKILAYVGRIVLPALATLLLSLGELWAIPYYQQIAQTITVLDTFLNALLQLDSKKYFEDKEIVTEGQGAEVTD